MLLAGLALGKAPLICAVAEKSIESREINKALKAGATMLEIRLDTFSKRAIKLLPNALKRLKARKIPLLLTIRSPGEKMARRVKAAGSTSQRTKGSLSLSSSYRSLTRLTLS